MDKCFGEPIVQRSLSGNPGPRLLVQLSLTCFCLTTSSLQSLFVPKIISPFYIFLQNPFNMVRTVFDPREGERELTLLEKSDLFFHDYSLSSLFVQENYLRAHPTCAR